MHSGMRRKHQSIKWPFLGRLIGLPSSVLFGVWVLMVLSFATAYFLLSSFGNAAGHGITFLPAIYDPWTRFGNALYFSIVTATTVGYGDLTPLGFSKALAGGEAVLGFLILAVLISKFVSHKQEIALYNVHKLAFQNAFFKTREGFYIIRRDCDTVAAHAKTHRALGDKSWSNLCIAYQKGQTLLEGILDFYDDFDWYNIDILREQLLLESVGRTLGRFASLLDELDRELIAWRKHAESVMELKNFAQLGKEVLQQWKRLSPHKQGKSFARLMQSFEKLAQRA